jgi:hypothetical protein
MQIAQSHRANQAAWSTPLPAGMDSPQTLVLAFGARALIDDPLPLQELAAAFPQATLLGCSSAGEINARQVGDDGLSVLIARFAHTRLQRARTTIADRNDSYAAGARLAAQLPAAGLRAVFMLSDGLAVNGTALLRGLGAVLPADVAVSGGMAGDGSLFKRTWVWDGQAPQEACVVAVGLYGPALRVNHGCSGGWLDFGPERVITRSDGNVLYELDGQPALALYKHYLGDLAQQLPGSALLFPLSVRAVHGAAPVVRTILAIDEAAQSMTFAGDVPEGAVAQLMRTRVDRLVASADEAAGQAMQGLGEGGNSPGPVLAVSVSCIGRRLVMGGRTDEELDAVMDRLPPGSMHAGFYSYGEIAPGQACTGSFLHNQTMTLTVFAESAD